LRRGAACLALLLALAASADAEVRPVEALGAAPLRSDEPTQQAPRDVALHHALREAVWRVALDELTERDRARYEDRLEAVLGDAPLDYATRFRILEDRGERPALFTNDPEVEREYVVLVEVHVDTDRVRQRLRQAGLLVQPSGEGRRQRLHVVLEGVESYATYQAVCTLLSEIGVPSALPVELERGRVVLEIEAGRSPDQLLAALVAAAPPNLGIAPLASDASSLTLRARFLGGPAELAPGAGAFDTP